MIARLLAAIRKRVAPIQYAKSIGVRIGNDCRMINCTFSTEPWLVSIGDHVSATKVHFETHDGGVWVFREEEPRIDIVKPIRVGNNVYIGYETVILPGVTIDDNAVIGARSVVTRDVAAGSVVAGVPARVIKSVEDYRLSAFSSAQMTKLMSPQEKREFYLRHYADQGSRSDP